MLSLAAGTVLDATSSETIDVARQAGYDGCGLRPGVDELTPAALQSLRRQLDDSGLTLLDLEVIRLGAPVAPEVSTVQVLDAAAVLSPRFVLAVSHFPDLDQTAQELGQLCADAAARGLIVALEFMMFTEVKTLADALAVIDATGAANLVVLVDALHLRRSGGGPGDLGRIPAGRLGYVQLCDGPAEAPADLADEARHRRLLPGLGVLPLAELLAASGDVPFSIEVQSEELTKQYSPNDRARIALEQTRRILSGQLLTG